MLASEHPWLASCRLAVRKEEVKLRIQPIILMTFGALAIGACTPKETVAVAPPPPPPLGSISGSTAADRDGDGIVDGYYTSDGIYHANYVPPPPAPPVIVSRRGERG
jgi:hypothetical protein